MTPTTTNDADRFAAEVRAGFASVWDSVAPPGRLLVGRVTGSRAYDTAGPDSDWDWSGVYVAPTARVLSVCPPKDTTSYTKGGGEDWTFHEARKFLLTLSGGNPNAVEALFLPPDALVPGEADLRPFWDELVARRREFLTERMMTHTLSYANGQLKRVRGEPVRESQTRPNKPVDRMKDACHGVRLLLFARDVACGREPGVRLTGDERETVMAVRFGRLDPDVIVDLAAALTAEVESLKPWPVAAEWPLAFADDWLYRLRRTEWA